MRKMPGQASSKYQVARRDTLQYTPHWYELWPICPPLIKGPFYVCELLFIQTKAYHLLAIYLVWTLQRKMLLLLCNYLDFLILFDNWLCNRAVESSIQVQSVGLSSWVLFKFNSWVKNWTRNAAQLTIELFRAKFKVNSEKVECHLLKTEEATEFVSHDQKAQFLLFSTQ